MTEREYDAIVVGAGPAGATAAFHLGAAGRRVLVLEKERLPRHKPCAGGVPASVLRRFPLDLSPVVERVVRRVRFRFADGREVAADLPEGAVVTVQRDRFDHYLASQARAEIRDGAPVADIRQDRAEVEAVLASGEAVRGRSSSWPTGPTPAWRAGWPAPEAAHGHHHRGRSSRRWRPADRL